MQSFFEESAALSSASLRRISNNNGCIESMSRGIFLHPHHLENLFLRCSAVTPNWARKIDIAGSSVVWRLTAS